MSFTRPIHLRLFITIPTINFECYSTHVLFIVSSVFDLQHSLMLRSKTLQMANDKLSFSYVFITRNFKNFRREIVICVGYGGCNYL